MIDKQVYLQLTEYNEFLRHVANWYPFDLQISPSQRNVS